MRASILIMTKAPRAGEVKTRLEPLLGPAGCARLQAELIRRTASLAVGVASRTWIAFAPADARAEIRALAPAGTSLLAQRGAHLGERLEHAVAKVQAEHSGPLLVIGTDSPLLGPEHVAAASKAIVDGSDAALVPALDGGYALIALARPTARAFAIPPEAWGGADVLALTVSLLRDGGGRVALLDPVPDLDTPEDAIALRFDPRCPAAIRFALASLIGAI